MGGTYAGCGAGGGVGRRTDRSIGSAICIGTGTGTDTGTGRGVGTCTAVGIVTGGGVGSRALSGDPAEYGGGDGAGCGARLKRAARRAGSA